MMSKSQHDAPRLPRPNLVILGSQKSGTTSLHTYLDQHPNIFMSNPLKEPGFFMDFQWTRDYWKKKGFEIRTRHALLSSFMLHGYSNEMYFGESSTYYTIGNYSERFQIPQRIRRERPSTRFLYLIRNPFERLVSSYLHEVRMGYVDLPFSDYLSSSRGKIAIRTSQYSRQLEGYLAHFTKEQIFVGIFENMIQHPSQFLNHICRFLGIAPIKSLEVLPPQNESSNRSHFSKEQLLFNRDTYDDLLLLFTKDLQHLQEQIGCKIECWDFSSNTWSLKS